MCYFLRSFGLLPGDGNTQNTMKIVYIGQKGIPATWGGVEQHVEKLSRRVAASGNDVIVYNRPHYASEEKANEYVKNTKRLRAITLRSLPTKHFDAIVHTAIATMHAIWKENPDIYHYQGVGPSLLSFLPRLFRPHARVITTFHSPDRLHQKWNWFAQWVLTVAEWTALHFAHKTVTVSHALQDYASETYGVTPAYIPNGVEIPQNRKPSLMNAEYGLEGNDYILVVSRLVRHKGIHYLIDAFKWMDTDKKLVIVGGSAQTDDYVSELHEMATDDDRIIFTGYQTGQMLEELFSNCYMYVQPSESEGLSISVLEAASYGAAILASDIPANSEIVRGKGFEFQNTNVSDLRVKLEQLLDNPEAIETAGRELRRHIIRAYNWETITDDTVSVYEHEYKTMLKAKFSVAE